jgi:DHA1 family bicyclomycin/chloramphenicol resistance-like MFS transporter
MTRKQYFIVVLILGSLSTISPFSIDMYLPGFPAIAKDLQATIAQVQLSLTSYLVGMMTLCAVTGLALLLIGRTTVRYRASKRVAEVDNTVLL